MRAGTSTEDWRTAWAAAVLIVISLVAFDPRGWAAFGPVKWAAVLTLAAIVVALLPQKVAFHRRSAMAWAAFLGWGIAVSLVAVDPVHTWIGTPDRHLGLLAWLVFAVLFLAGQALTSVDAIRLVLKGATVALLGIGVYAVLEWANGAPVDLTLGTDRFGGPFGSPAYLGAACSLLLPGVVGAAIDGLGSRLWRVMATASAAVGTVAAIGSQTRAAWVGLACAALFAVAATWSRRPPRRWAYLAIVVVAVGLLVASPVGERVRALTDPEDPSTRGRLDEWRIATELIVSRPITGAGFEGHRIVFPEEVDAAYERAYGRHVTPDRAHNGALDVGVTTGLPGMLLYLAGAVFLLRRAWLAMRTRRVWLVAIAVGTVAYVAQQQFLFPLAEVDPAFWVLAGVLVGSTSDTELIYWQPTRLVRGVAVGVAVFALIAGTLDVGADRAARAALAAEDQTEASQAADRATSLRPDSIRYWVVAAAVAAWPGTPDGLATAVDRIDSSLDISSEDPILRARKAEYLLDLARLTGDQGDIASAVEAWQELAEYDPNNAQYQLQYGVAAAVARDAVAAERAWLRSADLAPNSVAPLANLGALYLAASQLDAAEDVLQRGLAIDATDAKLLEVARQLEAATG